MNQPVTIELPDELARQAHSIAEKTNRRVEDVLVEWLGRGAAETSPELLPDDQVLALATMQMGEEQQAELSRLLARQREGTLDTAARSRLDELMTLYRGGMVRKAQPLGAPVERGLLPPVS